MHGIYIYVFIILVSKPGVYQANGIHAKNHASFRRYYKSRCHTYDRACSRTSEATNQGPRGSRSPAAYCRQDGAIFSREAARPALAKVEGKCFQSAVSPWRLLDASIPIAGWGSWDGAWTAGKDDHPRSHQPGDVDVS